jgi:sn-glycerol 3-phosphate transport system ATP-binding protein
MRLEIKHLQRDLGTTSVYVTHDQVEAMTLADRLIVMNAGRAEQIGTPMQVYEKPATAYVAGFIGSPAMNFLKGKVGADRRSVELGDGLTLKLSGQAEAAAGTAVTLGLRPEHMLPTSDEKGTLPLQVDLVEPLGADTLLHGRYGADRALLTVRLPGNVTAAGGSRRLFSIDPANLHLFGDGDGARVEIA